MVAMTSCFLWMTCIGQEQAPKSPQAIVTSDGVVRIPAMGVPLSPYMSEEARQAFVRLSGPTADGAFDWDTASEDQRQAYVDNQFRLRAERAKAVYPIKISERTIGGVRAEIIEPKEGIPDRNSARILINLHGGSFRYASDGLARVMEAIPIAGCARMAVVSVDYRLSPNYRFPAAVEDVVAVYKELLKTYKPQNIGIYGVSTGAALTAMSVAWFQLEGLPRPGGVGLFFEGAIKDDLIEGDSYFTHAALMGRTIPAANEPFPMNAYRADADPHDPLVAPLVSLKVLSKFPPTQLLSGTRDFGLSGVLYTHSRLVKTRVEANLHVWEGMWHGFTSDVMLPESKRSL
jgi:epsilon-lactone hydrolase